MGEARKGSKSVTYYIDSEIERKVGEFADATFRSKSQAIELLVILGLAAAEEQSMVSVMPSRTEVQRREYGELLDREPLKPGRKPARKKAAVAVAEEAPEAAPKPARKRVKAAPKETIPGAIKSAPRPRKPKAEPVQVEAAKPKARRGRPAKSAA